MKIAFVGTGNVASQLVKHLRELDFQILGAIGSTVEKTQTFAKIHQISVFSDKASLLSADLILLCVQDSKLPEVIAQYSEYAAVATTSGSFDIQTIKTAKNPVGVFYPLQSFTPDSPINFAEIPFFIESNDEHFSSRLLAFAKSVGKDGILMAGEERTKLHLAAVFINNFTHHVNGLAREFGESNDLDFSWYEALIKETFRKILNGAKDEDQTGPARRNDLETIQKHLSLLDPEKRSVYEALTNSILHKFHQK